MSRLLAFAFVLAASLPLLLPLQGCLMGGAEDNPVEVVRVDTLYADTLTIRDTTWIMDTSNALAGVWMMHTQYSTWTEGGTVERDTAVIDTANPLLREFYVIRAGSVFWSWYNPGSNNSDVMAFRQLTDTLWLLGETDTLTAVRSGNHLRIVYEGSLQDGVGYRIDIRFVAYARAFPPQEWGGASDTLPNAAPETAIPLAVDSAPQSRFLPAGRGGWFRFDAVAETSYLIRTFGETDTYLELFDTAAAMVLEENDDYEAPDAGLNAGIEWTAPLTGTYFVRLTGYDEFETGAYTISVTEIDGAGLGKRAHRLRKPPVHPLRALHAENRAGTISRPRLAYP